MHSGETVELFLLARREGMGLRSAGEFAGIGYWTAKRWARGELPRSYTGKPCRIPRVRPRGREPGMEPEKSTHEPPRTGPLASLALDQIENLPLRAVLADLKAGGWDQASISNRRKCELGERLRRETALPLRSITAFLRI